MYFAKSDDIFKPHEHHGLAARHFYWSRGSLSHFGNGYVARNIAFSNGILWHHFAGWQINCKPIS